MPTYTWDPADNTGGDLFKIVGSWVPTRSGRLTLVPPPATAEGTETDYELFSPAEVTAGYVHTTFDAWLDIFTDGHSGATYRDSATATNNVTAGVTYQMGLYTDDTDQVGSVIDYSPFAASLADFNAGGDGTGGTSFIGDVDPGGGVSDGTETRYGSFTPRTITRLLRPALIQDMWMAIGGNFGGATHPLAAEYIGAAYSRVQLDWAHFGSTGLVTRSEALFAVDPHTTLHGIGIFDNDVGGHLIASDLIRNDDGVVTPVAYPDGGVFVVPAGEFFLGFDLLGLP